MFRFANFIFNEYFSAYDKISDPNKDVNGKGTNERFINCLEDELDEKVLPLVENLQRNVIVPKTAYDKYVPYLESGMGYLLEWEWFQKQPLPFRRNLLAIMPKLYAIRGTERAHIVMAKWLGMELTIEEEAPVQGFDSPTTFDSDQRTFDSSCPTCSNYIVHLLSSYLDIADIPNDAVGFIVTVLEFNQPINADLTQITFNGVDISATFSGLFNADFNYNF